MENDDFFELMLFMQNVAAPTLILLCIRVHDSKQLTENYQQSHYALVNEVYFLFVCCSINCTALFCIQ